MKDLFRVHRDDNGRVTRVEVGFSVVIVALMLIAAVTSRVAS